jgi:hypothetical protein
MGDTQKARDGGEGGANSGGGQECEGGRIGAARVDGGWAVPPKVPDGQGETKKHTARADELNNFNRRMERRAKYVARQDRRKRKKGRHAEM